MRRRSATKQGRPQRGPEPHGLLLHRLLLHQLLVQPTAEPLLGCGRYIEMGYALARRMPVLVWMPVDVTNFDFWCRVPPVIVYRQLPELVAALGAPAFRLIEGPIA